uniref:Uncharacterized protein n=1 Tax=Branchiostoma floridae TaxID=7739 RepID=C3YB62_BRAFL|eukprot:XP_002606514.1 hypothetical protein BRAFLDRAFT_91902 [Branchiostoma floridae]
MLKASVYFGLQCGETTGISTTKELLLLTRDHPLIKGGVRTTGKVNIMELTKRTLKEAKDKCWLSHDAACESLYKSIPAVLPTLDHATTALALDLAEEVGDFGCPLCGIRRLLCTFFSLLM